MGLLLPGLVVNINCWNLILNMLNGVVKKDIIFPLKKNLLSINLIIYKDSI